MITRTTIYAEVNYEKIYKENGEVKKDVFEDTIPKCDTKEKAEIILSKENKGSVISILNIKFRKETRIMSEDIFYSNSTVKKEEYI